MRGKIIDGLFEEMAKDESLFFLTADMGINLVERFGESYPGRFLNVGIAEQNLIGVSAGLCNAGFRPFAYTISNFLVLRCLEQVRNDLLAHNYPAVLLGTSVGFDNASLGYTHHMLDDWGVMSTLPGIEIYCPTTVEFAQQLIKELVNRPRAAYVRIPKGSPSIEGSDSDIFTIPGADSDVMVCTYGGPAIECLGIKEHGVDPTIAIFNRVHPLEDEEIAQLFEGVSKVAVVEDQFSHCGLFSKVSVACKRKNLSTEIISVSPPSEYGLIIGTSPQFYFKQFGMDAKSVARLLN